MRVGGRGVRLTALLLGGVIALTACTGMNSSTDGSQLSTDESVLRSGGAPVGQTVGVPAGLGALAGGALGAILCRNNKAACAGGGALAGGLLGGGAGLFVAKKNQQYAGQEASLRERTTAAEEEIQRNDRMIAATNSVIAQRRQEIGVLRAEYRTNQGAAAGLQKERASLTEDIQALQKRISINEQNIHTITLEVDSSRNTGNQQLALQRQRLIQQQRELKELLAAMTGMTRRVPTS